VTTIVVWHPFATINNPLIRENNRNLNMNIHLFLW